jgi:hypothetical protein
MFQNLAAIDAETLKTMALGLSAGSVVIAIIMLKVISSIVGKAISTVLLLAVALVGYSQREQISSCIDEVKTQSSMTVPTEITCEFFGQEISVKVPVPSM